MKKPFQPFLALISLFSLIIGSSCHKSAGPGPIPTISGAYIESTPDAGGSSLNFITGSTVIATGEPFFLGQLSTPDTMQYFLTSGAGGPLISFVHLDGTSQDTTSCKYQVSGAGVLSLHFSPCPYNAYCGAFAGSVWVYNKQ